MSTNKYIILFIIFFVVMPCKVILAQEAESDTAQESELDIKYDSVLSKAASSLTDSAFKEAVDYYKEASVLKPNETYPYKMIKYVQSTMSDVAAKQKRSDELKRKAQIRDDLDKANEAIIDRNWDSAKFYFNEILTLQPEKTDGEYAKAKIEAIDLELQRVALRTPVKEEPPVVIPPKNRREARARRKIAERNATLAAASNKAATPKPTEAIKTSSAPLASAKNDQKSIAAPSPAEILQKSAEAAEPEKKVDIAETSGKQIPQETTITSLPVKTVALDSSKEISSKPTDAPSAAKNVQSAAPSPKTPDQPIEAPSAGKNVAGAVPSTKEIQQKPVQLPSSPAKNVTVAAPPAKDILHEPTEAPLPEKKAIAASPLNLSDSSDYVKLICQDISFIGTNAYIKMLIQNFSTTTNFLTDTLQVSIKKSNGVVKKLDQRFISNFPVIKPQNESVLVFFADASIAVDPDDIFILEMEDKMKQTKLVIQVPWNLYKQQKNL